MRAGIRAGKPSPPGSSSARSSPVRSDSRMPSEWVDNRNWRLPSGRALAEFALEAGFLAPFLMDSKPLAPRPPAGAQPAKGPASG